VSSEIKTKVTEAGNYFVSNYPPFSFWKPDMVPKALEVIEQPPQPNTPLGLYLHIPFCRKRCHFCYFKVYTDRKASEIRNYTESAVRELAHYAKKPFIGGRKLDFVYFGGGTPSYLSSAQLDDLTKGLKDSLPWDDAREVTFECEPGTLTESKLEAIRNMGVTRLSLGVENFDERILEVNGRAHRGKEIGRAYEWARKLNFPQINIDLIAGMLEETEANWQDCIQKAIEMEPDSITIYQMEVPYNTTIYKRMQEDGSLVAPVADWETKRRWVDEAFRELEKHGYGVGSAYTAARNPEKTKFVYRDALWHGADLLSLGVSSFSHINGVHFQNQAHIESYLENMNRGELPIFRAMAPDRMSLLVRELVLQLKLGHLSQAYFQKKFGVDVLQEFSAPFAILEEMGLIASKSPEIVLTRDGLLQIDFLLNRFFLEEHRDARYT